MKTTIQTLNPDIVCMPSTVSSFRKNLCQVTTPGLQSLRSYNHADESESHLRTIQTADSFGSLYILARPVFCI